MSKKEQMIEALRKIEEICRITRPECVTQLTYIRLTKENIDDFNEWDRQRFALHVGDERILVSKNNEGVLYALNVTANSVMQSIADLTDLLAGKGW